MKAKLANWEDYGGKTEDQRDPSTAPQTVQQVDAEMAHNIARGGVGRDAPTPYQDWSFPNPTTDVMSGVQSNPAVPVGPAIIPYSGGMGSGGDVDQGGHPIYGGDADPSLGGTVGTTGGGGGGFGGGLGGGGEAGPGVPGIHTPAYGGAAQTGNFGNNFINMQAYLNANQGQKFSDPGIYGSGLLKTGAAGTSPLSGAPPPPLPVDPKAPPPPPSTETLAQSTYRPSGNYTSGMAGVDQMLSQGFTAEEPRFQNTPTRPIQQAPEPAEQPFSGMSNQLNNGGISQDSTLGLGGFSAAAASPGIMGPTPNTTTPTANGPAAATASTAPVSTTTPVANTSAAPAAAPSDEASDPWQPRQRSRTAPAPYISPFDRMSDQLQPA